MKNVFGLVVGFAILFSPTALALLASARLSKQSVEEWQLLAWVPPLPLVIFWIYRVVTGLLDPTSGNLWPFAMLLCAALSGVLFGLFFLGRKLSRSSEPRRPWQH